MISDTYFYWLSIELDWTVQFYIVKKIFCKKINWSKQKNKNFDIFRFRQIFVCLEISVNNNKKHRIKKILKLWQTKLLLFQKFVVVVCVVFFLNKIEEEEGKKKQKFHQHERFKAWWHVFERCQTYCDKSSDYFDLYWPFPDGSKKINANTKHINWWWYADPLKSTWWVLNA